MNIDEVRNKPECEVFWVDMKMVQTWTHKWVFPAEKNFY